ncbi:hypothetical protein Tco_0582401, partial [Tanacetum coccineum]
DVARVLLNALQNEAIFNKISPFNEVGRSLPSVKGHRL